MNSREALIVLNMLEHVGPVRFRALLQHFETPEKILSASRAQLERVEGIGSEVAEAIVSWKGRVDLAAELRRIEESKCRVVIESDAEYPALLKQIYDPPILLYVKGTIPAGQLIALVGSRQTTPYGMETSRRFAGQLTRAGMIVVSGGARGIDTAAHEGALKAGGKTVAVLGTGINLVFPSENAELFERIAAQGALVTQFPFNRPADKQSFPIRNRIVAGMSHGTVVIEANLTSGALITANMANDFGRHVFAVPGRIDSPRSKGCHDLIKKGAKLCEGVEDILVDFEFLFPQRNEEEKSRNFHLSSAEEKLLLALGEEPIGIDLLLRHTGLTISVAMASLLSLEIKRLIRQLPGKHFVRLARGS
jgi:DNA processing protein